MKSEAEVLEKLSTLTKVQMSTQRQQDIRNIIDAEMKQGKYGPLKRRFEFWRSSLATLVAIAVFAIVVGGFEHDSVSTTNPVRGSSVKSKSATQSHHVNVPKLGGQPLTKIFRATIQRNGTNDQVLKAIYFKTKTDGRNVPGVAKYFNQEGGIFFYVLYGKSFIVIARGKFNATDANGNTGSTPANTVIAAYTVTGDIERRYFLNLSKSAFAKMQSRMTQTSSPHELPYTTHTK